MHIKNNKPRSFLRLVHDQDDPLFGVVVVVIFKRIVPGIPITQHTIWFPEDPPIIPIRSAFESLPHYVQDEGLRFGEDDEGFYVCFTGDLKAPTFMHRALSTSGISSTIMSVRCHPEYAIVLP